MSLPPLAPAPSPRADSPLRRRTTIRGRVHVVVLAAGTGSRLGRLADRTPKWLLDVGGRPIAERHLDAVAHVVDVAAGAVRSVRVVTGHNAPAIERFVAQRGTPRVRCVHNAAYASLNNWYSLLLALRSLDAELIDDEDRLVVFNADLLAAPTWMARFVLDSALCEEEGLIAVDLERPVTDESMKVSLRRADAAGPTVELIGKLDVEAPEGEYVGMLMARGALLRALRATLETFVGRPESANEWYERAVRLTAADGAAWTVWPTPDSDWVEIDDEHDYATALRLTRGG